MIPCLGYLRVSGLDQVEGDGFRRQRDTISQYALAHGFEVVAWYQDVAGHSNEELNFAEELQRRVGLAAVLEHMESGEVKTCLVEFADRFARDQILFELFTREFQKLNAQLIDCKSGVDLAAGTKADPTRKFIRTILAAVAELDKNMIVLKLRAARERIKRTRGKCEGRHEYGHSYFPGEQAIVARIIRLHLEGNDTRTIARLLNESGTKTRYGKAWIFSGVAKILAREKRKAREAKLSPAVASPALDVVPEQRSFSA